MPDHLHHLLTNWYYNTGLANKDNYKDSYMYRMDKLTTPCYNLNSDKPYTSYNTGRYCGRTHMNDYAS
jgi:hypothetical protein